MFTENELLRQLDKQKAEGKGCFNVDRENRKVYNLVNGEYICTIDTLVDYFRHKMHCNFEVIYSDEGSLSVVYRCKDCGCVIFGGDDERYDPNLKCPCCGGYHCRTKYWSKEQIDNDKDKQEYIYNLELAAKRMEECYARMKRRDGKLDSQIWVKENHIKDWLIEHELGCCDFFSERNRLKGLYYNIHIYKQDESKFGYNLKKKISIPLSFYHAYLIWILPHTKSYKDMFKNKEFDSRKTMEV